MLLPYINNKFKQKEVTAMPVMTYIFMVTEMTELILILDFILTKNVAQWKYYHSQTQIMGFAGWLFVLFWLGLGFFVLCY